MSDGTAIEWTDATVNAINGCSVTSPGCTNCYAMRLAGTRMKHHPSRAGLTIDSRAGPVWNGTVRLHEPALLQPLRWKRQRTIFWNAHGDTFHDAVPDEWIDRMFAVMALTPQHKHLVLTKRPARMRAYLTDAESPFHRVHYAAAADIGGKRWGWINDYAPRGSAITQYNLYLQVGWPLPNVWLGVSVEDQARADERIPDLLATPAAGRFLSCEPLLGPVNLDRIKMFDRETEHGGWETGWESCLNGKRFDMWAGDDEDPMRPGWPKIDGVIVGGESGTGARPMHPNWARSLRDQCAAAGVDFHFKQWGNFSPLLSALPVEGEGVGAVAWPDGTVGGGRASQKGGAGQQMYCAIKKIAGRLLDGRTHDALPWTREL